MLQPAIEVLKTCKSFAVIGVSREPDKYGHEVFATLLSGGYTVYPVNPKYAEVKGHTRYPSLGALPARPDVVVVALAPAITERMMPDDIASGVQVIWLPPGCFTPAAVEACQAAGVRELQDICPVFAL
jgi:predicted CoA-binding protein